HRRRARRLQRLGRARREPAREPRLHRLLGPARSQLRARPFLPGPGRSVRDAAHPARRRDRVFFRPGRHRAALRDQRDARVRAGSVLRPAAASAALGSDPHSLDPRRLHERLAAAARADRSRSVRGAQPARRLTVGYRLESALQRTGGTSLLASGGPNLALALPVGELDLEAAGSTDGAATGAAASLSYTVFTRRLSAGGSIRAMSASYSNLSLPAAADRPL